MNQSVLDQSSVDHLQEAIQLVTLSNKNEAEFNSQPFVEFQHFLATTYPLADSLLNPEVINNYSVLYSWKGSNPSAKPIILATHIDVVPVDGPTKKDWQVEPFSGKTVDGSIWGRGSMDDKGSLVATMEATEQLLREGYQPTQTIYLAFGHDEEIGGKKGAA